MSILKKYTAQQVDVFVREIQTPIEREFGLQQALDKLPIDKEFHEELVEIASARLSAEKTSKNLFMLKNDLRFATNEVVAAWRAKRLSCNKIIDLGCGIGVQAIAFSKTCKEVIGVDIDERKILYAKANAELQGIKNISFVCDDAITSLKGMAANAIFWDPERPASEQMRSVKSLQPDFDKLSLEAKKVTDNMAIEFPPQIQELPEGFEAEYCSVDGKLNRLTIYSKALAGKSVVALPSGSQIFDTGKKAVSGELQEFIGEVDEAVIKSGLVGELGFSVWEQDESLVTGNALLNNDFIKWWKVLAAVEDIDDEVKRALKVNGAGNIVLHQRIQPEMYWKTRNILERGLKGNKTLAVFRTGKSAVIAQRVVNNKPTT